MQLKDLIEIEPRIENLISKMPADIWSKCIIKKFSAGSIVVKKEDPVKQVYMLLKGELKVINEFENGNIYIVANILPINFIGELEVLAGELTHAVTIEAVTECVTFQTPSGDFTKWLECDHTILLTVARILAKKMYPTSYENGNIIFRPGIRKVQSFIIKNYQEKSVDRDILLIDKKRQQIADEIGIGIKTVNRSIKKLKEEGLVSIRKGKIHVNSGQYLRILSIIKE